MKRVLVLYHSDCPDGFGAAWAAWKKFGKKAEYIAVPPRRLPDVKLAGRDIYVLDNSYPAAVQRKLRTTNTKLVVIDHHGSSKADVEAFPENVFDGKHCGSVLSWKYFHPEKPVPRFLKYVEDGDLWRFTLPQSGPITTYINARAFDFKGWSEMARALETKRGRDEYVKAGKAIQVYTGTVVAEAVRKADMVRFAGKKVLAVNSSARKFNSAIGHELVKIRKPFAVVWYLTKKNLHVSLRSVGAFDVSKVARKFRDGGGHRNAAGFTIPFTGKFPWKAV